MPAPKFRLSALVPALMLALLAGACDSGDTGVNPEDQPPTNGDQAATLTILLTDAPADYVAEANVDIGRVEILPVGDGPPIVLTEDGTDGFVNLLELQESATMQIAQVELEPGAYHQLRLHVEAANVKLIEGYTFRDGSQEMDLKVPSGAQTGIKLLLRDVDDQHLQLVPGEKVVVLDFDVNRSFVIQGNPETPAGIKSMLFTPTIKVTGMDVAASISGTVSTQLDGVPVEGRVVMAEPTDDGDLTEYGYQTAAGTAVTDGNGDYTIFFLVPGEYEVSVMDLEPGLGTDPISRTLTLGWAEEAGGADFEIIDVTGSISGAVSVAEGIEGVSLEGWDVTATPTAEGQAPVTVATDADGAYTFQDLLPGTYTVAVDFEGEGLAIHPAEVEVDVGRAEDVTGVDFVIVEAGSIAGAVSTEIEGFVLENLDVTATAEGMDPVSVKTAADGTYIFTGLAPATYTLTVAVGDDHVTVPESITVVMEENSGFANQDFVVEEKDTSS